MDILNLMGYNDLSISVSESIHILKKSGQNSFRTSTYESNIAILISIFRQMCTWFLSLLFPHHQGLERNNSSPRPIRYSLNSKWKATVSGHNIISFGQSQFETGLHQNITGFILKVIRSSISAFHSE